VPSAGTPVNVNACLATGAWGSGALLEVGVEASFDQRRFDFGVLFRRGACQDGAVSSLKPRFEKDIGLAATVVGLLGSKLNLFFKRGC
jgi:hypothetical protein